MLKPANQYRERLGIFGSGVCDGANGVFSVPFRTVVLRVVISNGFGWDHVSVSLKKPLSKLGRDGTHSGVILRG